MLTRKRKRDLMHAQELPSSKALRQPPILSAIFSHCNPSDLQKCSQVNWLWNVEATPRLWYGDRWGNPVNPGNHTLQAPSLELLAHTASTTPKRLRDLLRYTKILSLESPWPTLVEKAKLKALFKREIWEQCHPTIFQVDNAGWLEIDEWILAILGEGIQMVDIKKADTVGEVLIKDLKVKCPSLRWLRLSGVGPIDNDVLVSFLTHNSTIEVFEYGTTLSNYIPVGEKVFSALGDLPNLKGMEIEKFELGTFSEAPPFYMDKLDWPPQSKFRKLEHCVLQCWRSDIAPLFEAINSQATKLLSLFIQGAIFEDTQPESLLTSLCSQTNLEFLDVTIFGKPFLNQYDTRYISNEYLINLVKSCPNLRRLAWKCKGNQYVYFEPFSVETFTALTSCMPKMNFLWMDDIELADEDRHISYVITLAKYCPNIRVFRLPVSISIFDLKKIPTEHQLTSLDAMWVDEFKEYSAGLLLRARQERDPTAITLDESTKASILQEISDILDKAMPNLVDLGPYIDVDGFVADELWSKVLESQMAKACDRLPESEKHVIGDCTRIYPQELKGPTNRYFEGWKVKQRVAFFERVMNT